ILARAGSPASAAISANVALLTMAGTPGSCSANLAAGPPACFGRDRSMPAPGRTLLPDAKRQPNARQDCDRNKRRDAQPDDPDRRADAAVGTTKHHAASAPRAR